jgi:predicted Rossmann-fold nucleotide-binding protein
MGSLSRRLAFATALVCAFIAFGASALSGKTVFDPNRSSLYSQKELWKGFDANAMTPSFDERVYREYLAGGKFFPDSAISKLRSQHDEGIANALRSFAHDTQRNIIGIMGSGNPGIRCKLVYEKTVRVAWLLAHDGRYLIATGGGPGQMEAANLGAYLANNGPESIDEALKILRTDLDRNPETNELRRLQTQTCSYKNAKGEDDQYAYTAAAQAVIAKFGSGHASLGIPTWFYGNEPTNVFATTVAKFFSNGIREDLLVTIAMGGLVMAPGSAGTRQEIFMDMTQNFYASFCYRSPVVFLGVDYWGAIPTETSKDGKIVEREDDGVYSLVHKLTPPDFRGMLVTTDVDQDVLAFLKAHPPTLASQLPDGCDKMP